MLMAESVDFLGGRDPLGRDIPLPQVLDATVFGVPVRFESNSAFVIDVAAEAYAPSRLTLAGQPLCLPLTVRVVVHDGGATSEGDRSRIRSWAPDRTRLIVHGPDLVAVADARRGHSIAYVGQALVERRALFRHTVLEAMTLALVSYHDRHPVHAAAVGRNGAAVLLWAASGTGKSTLAYAAHLAGLDVLTDDVAWVQLRPRMMVWGATASRRILLMPDARDRFPSLAAAEPTLLASGKCKIPVDLGAPARGAQMTADRATVCVLERAAGPTTLTRASADTIVAALTSRPGAGFDRYPKRLWACASALAAGGGWRLAVSSDPASAIPALMTMLDSFTSSPA
jgi:hypothetical protein